MKGEPASVLEALWETLAGIPPKTAIVYRGEVIAYKGLADPCYSRTLFVRPVGDILEVADYCGKLTQTVGCALSPERKLLFAEKVSYAGIDRCPDVGLMSLYDSPRDGLFPMDRMVRWVKA